MTNTNASLLSSLAAWRDGARDGETETTQDSNREHVHPPRDSEKFQSSALPTVGRQPTEVVGPGRPSLLRLLRTNFSLPVWRSGSARMTGQGQGGVPGLGLVATCNTCYTLPTNKTTIVLCSLLWLTDNVEEAVVPYNQAVSLLLRGRVRVHTTPQEEAVDRRPEYLHRMHEIADHGAGDSSATSTGSESQRRSKQSIPTQNDLSFLGYQFHHEILPGTANSFWGSGLDREARSSWIGRKREGRC